MSELEVYEVTVIGPMQLEQVSRGRLQAAVAQANHFPRFLATPDVGIDGDIEFCHEGRPTGARLAFQLKAGAAYISSITNSHINVRIECKHLRYWCCVNMPVLLIYFHPETEALIWADVKAWLLESGFDPTSQQTTVIPVPRANAIPGDSTEKWRQILSLAPETHRQIEEQFRLRIPELALFRDPRYLPTAFAFTTERIVIVEQFDSVDWTLIEVPEHAVPPEPLTTTLLTIFSRGQQSTGWIRTQVGWPEIPFDTMFNDTIPLELALLFRSFNIRLNDGSAPVKLVCKGYGFFLPH